MSKKTKRLTGKKRFFQVIVTCRVELELDEAVLSEVNDDWRRQFYPFATPEEIAAHVGYAMAREGFGIDLIDGFAMLPREAAKITDEEWEAEATPA